MSADVPALFVTKASHLMAHRLSPREWRGRKWPRSCSVWRWYISKMGGHGRNHRTASNCLGRAATIAPHEYEELRRLKSMRRSFATEDLSDEEFEAIASSRMDPRHDHLNKILAVTR
jgi:hypothetical protein